MQVQSNPASVTLEFSSAPGFPVAYRSGHGLDLATFRWDVERLCEHIVDSDPGETLISCSGRYGFGVALLATWIAGRVAILPPDQHPETLQKIRKQHSIAYECNDRWTKNIAESSSDETVAGHGIWPLEFDPASPAVMLYTSGSSGTPMRVHKNIGNLIHEAKTLRRSFDWPNGAIVGTVPAQHLYGLSFTIMLPWVSARPWVDDIPLYPEDLKQVVTELGASTLVSVPAHYKALMNNGFKPKGLFSISAAAPLPKDTARAWLDLNGSSVQEVYGSSETGVIAHRKQLEDAHWQPFSTVLASEEDGLLKVKSPFVSEKWQSGFHTSDLVEFGDRNLFKLKGRVDSITKIGGKRVSLAAIEVALRECPGVVDAALLAVDIDGHVRDKVIWAVVTGVDSLSARLLRSELRKKLDGICIPRRFVFVESLPRNAWGKTTRPSLLALFDEQERASV